MQRLVNPYPYHSFAQWPTPVKNLPSLGDQVYMKQEGRCAPHYGGNKIRKLEFLLGKALSEGRRSVITYGAAGSNHALATAICCREANLRTICMLAPQPANAHVRKNLLMQLSAGSELVHCNHYREFPEATERWVERCIEEEEIAPFIIPAGGTCFTGALGYVQAAFELAEQMQPDVIYLPMGTGGTLAGLLVGFLAAGLETRIEAIRVVDPALRNRKHIKSLCDELCDGLGLKERVPEEAIRIRDEFFGSGYGIPTPEAEHAVDLMAQQEGLHLETTYTGKTVAALLHDLESDALEGRKVLYWNTLNAQDLSTATASLDYHDLPPEFHAYFKPTHD